MLGPLICEEGTVQFVKGHFRRPFAAATGGERPDDGGRVTELTARPLLSAFYPELAAFIQPLAGEVAARRSFFDRLPFATGYAIETSMLLHARDALGGTDGMAQVDLEERHNHHQPLRELGPMAYAVLRVILERLRDEGRLRRRPRPAAPDRRRPADPGRARRAAAVCHPARSRVVGIRCVYTDLDGTLLGKGASLFRTAEGDFTLLAARALEACHRAGAEVVIKSGRRRAQVMEDARLLGQTSYIFEVGSGLVIDGEVTFLTGDLQPREGRSIHARSRRSGAPALLLERYAGRLEPHAPWHVDREVSHLFRGLIDVREANELLAAEGPRAGCGWSTTARSSRERTPST